MPYTYTRPMPFTEGDILGASNINMIVRNQRWLREVTEPVAGPKSREYSKANGDTGSHTFYVRHGGNSNRLRVHMDVWLEQIGTVSLYYKETTSSPVWEQTFAAGSYSINQLVDISNHPPNAHPVAGELVMVKLNVSTSSGWTVSVHRLGEVVPSSEIQYQKVSGNFADGTVAYARHLNQLVQNDVELGALVSPSPGFRMTEVNDYGQQVQFYIRHGGDSDRLRLVFTYTNDTTPEVGEDYRSHIEVLYNGQLVLKVPDDVISKGDPHRFMATRWFDKIVDLPTTNHPNVGQWSTVTVLKTPGGAQSGSPGNPAVCLYYIGEERYL